MGGGPTKVPRQRVAIVAAAAAAAGVVVVVVVAAAAAAAAAAVVVVVVAVAVAVAAAVAATTVSSLARSPLLKPGSADSYLLFAGGLSLEFKLAKYMIVYLFIHVNRSLC